MEKSCFFCTTPFQVITAIHLTMARKKETKVDLYIVDQFANAAEVAVKVRDTKIFHDVKLIKEELLIDNKNSSKFYIWGQILFSYLVINRKAKEVLQKNIDVYYKHMYISSKAFVPRLVALYYAKKRVDTEIIYYDDGLGSYYDRNILYPRFSDKIIRRIIFGKKAHGADPKKVLLYSPDLFYKADINASEDLEVEEIPKWNCNPKLKNIINRVFSYSEEDEIKEPILIFDGLYTGEKRKTLDKIYKKIAEVAGVANVIIKKHPRDKDTGADVEKLKYYSRPNIPFELICLNTVMKEKLLIGINTTAVITPVLLLNEEPYVLVLSNVPELSTSLDVNFKFFKELYKSQERFYEAQSLSDAIAFEKFFCDNRFT